MKVLVIDDDPRIVKSLSRILKDDYVVDTALTAHDGENLAYDSHYDAIILDLILPDMDGEDLCRMFKTNLKNTPVLVISGKSTVNDKDIAFDKGADDYLVKPFNSRELKARIKALIRRSPNMQVEMEDPDLRVRDLHLDRLRRALFYKNNRIILRRKEMQLLEFLLANKGRVLTRTEILEHVWDSNVSIFTNTVDVHVKRLRDRIEVPFKEKYIETVHGIGYIIE